MTRIASVIGSHNRSVPDIRSRGLTRYHTRLLGMSLETQV